MDMRVFCKLCDEKHLAGRHNLEGVKVRPWLQGFTGADPTATKAPVSVTRDAKKPLSVTTAAVSVTRCAECGTPFEPKRATAKFCSAKCRVRASRKGDGE